MLLDRNLGSLIPLADTHAIYFNTNTNIPNIGSFGAALMYLQIGTLGIKLYELPERDALVLA